MSRTNFAASLGACVVALGLVLVGASSAQAEDAATCTTAVVDTTAGHRLDVPAVEKAVEQANATGADFYVRAFETTPNGSLDAYWQQSIKDCANWRNGTAENGVPKGNIVLVAFAMDHKSAIFYGSGYNNAIGPNGANMVRAKMNDSFRVSDFTNGVVGAVGELGAMADPNQAPPKSQPDKPSKPVDLAWLGVTALWALGVLVFVALLIGMYFLNRKRIDLGAARRDLITAKQEAAVKVSSWESEGDFLDVTFLTGGEPLPQKVQSRDYPIELIGLGKSGREASELFGEYAQDKAYDPQNRRLDVKQLNKAAKAYRKIADVYDTITTQLASLKEDAAADLKRYSFDDQATRATQARKSLTTMRAKLGDYDRLFATTIVNRKCQRLETTLTQIEALLASKSDQLASYEQLEEFEDELDKLASEFDQMESAASNLSNPRETLRSALKRGHQQLADMKNIDTSEEKQALELLDGNALGVFLAKLDASKSYDRQLGVFDTFNRNVDKIVGRARARDDEYRAKQDRKREKEKRRQREESYRRSSSGSSSDSLFGGAVGGLIGSSLGGSSHHDSGSSSSSGFDFGGGSSGGWGGGGGDFGGGSSGSW